MTFVSWFQVFFLPRALFDPLLETIRHWPRNSILASLVKKGKIRFTLAVGPNQSNKFKKKSVFCLALKDVRYSVFSKTLIVIPLCIHKHASGWGWLIHDARMCASCALFSFVFLPSSVGSSFSELETKFSDFQTCKRLADFSPRGNRLAFGLGLLARRSKVRRSLCRCTFFGHMRALPNNWLYA